MIEGNGPAVALLGGAEDLNGADGLGPPAFPRIAQISGQTRGEQLCDGARRLGLEDLALKEKVRVPRAKDGHLPTVDQVRVPHDHAALVLAEYVGQAHAGHRIALQDVAEHVARAHAGQLVRIAHQNQARARHHRA